MGKLFKTFKQAASEFSEDRCTSSAAAIAYYSIFALPPLLVIVFMAASYAGISQQQINDVVNKQLGIPTATAQAAAQGKGSAQKGQGTSSQQKKQASSQGKATSASPQSNESKGQGSSPAKQANSNSESQQPDTGAGSKAADAPQQSGAKGESPTALGKVAQRAKPGEIAGIGAAGKVVGLLILIFTATGLFSQLQYALNRAWEVEPDPERGGVKRFLIKRLFSLGMILVMAFLLLVSLVISTLIEQILAFVQGATPDLMVRILSFGLDNLATFALATLLFAAMYKILPDADMAWRDTFVGAGWTALLFIVGKTAIALYLQRSDVGASWGGAAASLVAVLAWLYYTSIIVLFGAELTQVWAKTYGQGIRPSEGAVRTVEEKHYQRDRAA